AADHGAPPAIMIGTAAPENASDAAASPYHDFSAPRTTAAASSADGHNGTRMDQPTDRAMVSQAPSPPAPATAAQQASHHLAARESSRMARRPRCPRTISAGS